MEDMVDCIALCASGLGYTVTRSPPSVFIGGVVFPAQSAAAIAWSTGLSVTSGQRVNNVGNVFEALTDGVTAGSGQGPMGIGQSISDGGTFWRFVGAQQSTFTIMASLQPLKGAELDRLPEEYRTKEVRALWTNALLQTSGPAGEADVVTANGFDWQVAPMEQWEDLGNYRKVLVVRIGR